MAERVTIVGVHLVQADEPVHLIEISIDGSLDDFDFGDITQERPNKPQSNWQVAYDERVLERTDRHARCVFFFHYLDADQPLQTSFGPAALPAPSPVPEHLASIEYEAP